jgi:hypothetical protein
MLLAESSRFKVTGEMGEVGIEDSFAASSPVRGVLLLPSLAVNAGRALLSLKIHTKKTKITEDRGALYC